MLERNMLAEATIGTWLSDFVNNDSTTDPKPSHFFPNLQTLDICPPTTEAGLSAALTFIKRTAPTLSSLIIRHPSSYLDSKEANQVVYALTGMESEHVESMSKLKSLQMNISHLQVPFIELLASKFPQLQKLHLRVTNFCAINPSWVRSFLFLCLCVHILSTRSQLKHIFYSFRTRL